MKSVRNLQSQTAEPKASIRKRVSEAGNVFLAIFGAIAMVGIIGGTATSVIKGPMKTMAESSQRAQAESEIMANMRLSVLAVAELAEQDCDLDGTVEPVAWDAGTGPVNGGLLPTTVRTSSGTDPWDTRYGYCVWDHGTLVDNAGCGGAGQNRLPGLNTTTFPPAGAVGQINKQTTIAIISAGPDRTFETTCRDWASADIDGGANGQLDDAADLPLVGRAGDDLIFELNYGEASVMTSSQWKVKASTGDTAGDTEAQIDSTVELGGGRVQIGDTNTGLLDLSAGGLVLPRETNATTNAVTGNCIDGGLNDNQLRLNTETSPSTLEICADGSWQQISGTGTGNSSSCQAYTPNAVDFDGTNDFLETTSLNLSPTTSKQWSGSFWFKRDSLSNWQVIFDSQNTIDSDLTIDIDSSDQLYLGAKNSSHTDILVATSTAINDTSWHHVMFSIDLSDTAKRHVYIDGTAATMTWTTYTDDFINFDSSGYTIGANNFGGHGSKAHMELADFWTDFGTYIDLSIASNRERFLNSDGTPIYLGSMGELPTGSQPELFFAGDTASWHLNRGTAGNFTENGTLTDGTDPSAGTDCTGKVATDCSAMGDADYTDSYSKHCYYKETTGTTWSSAKTACEANNGYLLVPSSQNENEAVFSGVTANTCYIGGTDSAVEGEWRWSGGELDGDQFWSGDDTGSAVGGLYTNWTSGEPSNAGGSENCTNYEGTVQWNDVSCTSPVRCYVCEIPVSDYVAPGADFTNNLIGYWRFDETSGTTAVDDINSNDGTLTNMDGSTDWVSGIADNGLDFDGSNDTVLVGNPAELNNIFATGATVSAWVNFDTLVSNRIIDKSRPGNAGWYLAPLPDGTLVLGHRFSGTDGDWHTSAGDIETGKWIHVALTYDNSSNTNDPIFYIDGAPVSSSDFNSPSGSASDDSGDMLNFGNRNDAARPLNGKMDDVRIYNRILTADEIAQVYDAKSGDYTRNLAARWRLDETEADGTTIADSAGSNNGTFSGDTEVNEAPGIINRALRFDGSNDYIDTTDIDFATGGFSYGSWFKTTATGTQRILSKYSAATNQIWVLVDDGDVECGVYDGSAWVEAQLTSTHDDGQWHHAMCVVDGSDVILYVDGAEAARATGHDNAFPTNNNVWRIGAINSGGEYFDGDIDDVRIYSEALTAAQVQRVYDAGQSTVDLTNGLVAHWTMEETSGTTVADSVGSNDGTFSGEANVVSDTGFSGNALRFDGSDDQISVTYDEEILPHTSYTISGWIYADYDNYPTSSNTYIWQRANERHTFVYESTGGGHYGACHERTSGPFFRTSLLNEMSANEWNHVACVYDGATLATYINGALAGTETGIATADTDNFIIGEDYAGVIDDIKIYNRALNEEEMRALYDSYQNGVADCTGYGNARYINVGNGHCYYRVDTADTWDNAKADCEANGHNLATFNGAGEGVGVERGLKFTDRHWIGAKDTSSDDNWFWHGGDLNGQQFWSGNSGGSAQNGLAANWDTGQPESNSDDCATLNDVSGQWGDTSCAGTQAYVCENENVVDDTAYGIGIIEDFTSEQQVTQSGSVSDTLGSHSAAITLNSLEFGEEVGIGFIVDSTPASNDPAMAGIAALRSGNAGEHALAFKTQNAAGEYASRAYLDSDGDLGLGVTNFADVYAKIQINDMHGDSWSSSYNQGLLVNSVSGTISSGEAITPVSGVIGAGNSHSCGLGTDTNFYCWGDGGSELGIGGGFTDQPEPVQVLNGESTGTFSYIAAGHNTCGVGTDQKIYCWGANTNGQNGNGSIGGSRDTPEEINAGESPGTFTQVSKGTATHTCAIGTNSKAYCWGRGYQGKLGHGSSPTSQTSPVEVHAGENSGGDFVQISAGEGSTCAIGTDNNAYCWGGRGGLGDGGSGAGGEDEPRLVHNGESSGSFKQVDAGGGVGSNDTSCAVGTDDKAYCWGGGGSGILGNNSTSNQTEPVEVHAGENTTGGWIQVSVGYSHSCGLGFDGSAYCWGLGTNGRLGNNATANALEPVKVLNGESPGTFLEISAGNNHTCALGTDNKGYCWGLGSAGRLGNNATADALTPVEVHAGENTDGTFGTISGSATTDNAGIDGLIHYWPLDEESGSDITDIAGSLTSTWDDSSGNDVTEEAATGVIDGAIDFDGSDDKIITAANFAPPDAGTIAMWVAFDSTGQQRFFGSGGDYEIMINSSNELDADIFGSGGFDTIPFTPTLGQWYHIAITYDISDGTSEWYIDGVDQLDGNTLPATNTEGSTEVLHIGARNGNSNELNGKLDEVRIYNRALSAEEITTLYNYNGTASNPSAATAFIGLTGGSTSTDATSGLVSQYGFNETSGTSAADSVGSNTGTLTNFPASPWFTDGTRGNVLEFSSDGGNDDFVDAGTWDVNGTGITLAAWVYSRDNTSNDPRLIIKTNGYSTADHDWGLMIESSDDSLSFRADTGSGGKEVKTTATVFDNASLNTWKHVAVTYDESTDLVSFYVDGVFLESGTHPDGGALVTGSGKTVHIGNNSGGLRTIDGYMDDVRIYSRPLSSTEIASVYAATSSGNGSTNTTILYGSSLKVADTDLSASTTTDMMTLSDAGLVSFTDNFLDVIDGTLSTTSGSTTASEQGIVRLQRADGTASSPSSLSDGDTVAALAFSARSTSGITGDANAAIYGKVNGAPSGGNLPVDLHFSTDTAGNATGSSDMVLTQSGDLGIGTTAPVSKVQVADRIVFNEGLRVGNDTNCSGAGDAGTIRYADSALEYCDGASWITLYGSSGSSFTEMPDGISAVYGWGNNGNRQTGEYSGGASYNTPQLSANIYGVKKAVAGGNASSCVLTYVGNVYCWGEEEFGQLGNGVTTATTEPEAQKVDHPSSLKWIELSGFTDAYCAIDSAQDLYCWGKSDFGQMGDGSTASNSTPGIVSGSHKWASIGVGNLTTCGVTTAGDGYCWGRGTEGQLGDGANLTENTPQLVSGGHTWKFIEAGEQYSCGVTTAGDGYCWGNQAVGSIGNGTSSGTVNTPQLLNVGITWRQISASRNPCGVTDGGQLLCWGTTSTLGVGTGTVVIAEREYPAPMGADIEWHSVDAGAGTNCGIDIYGNAYCWGQGNTGERGDGANNDTATTPQPVSGNLKFRQISSGNNHVLGLTHPENHRATYGVAWGHDGTNKLGNDSTVSDQSVPRLVHGHTDWAQLSLGTSHACGLKQDQSLWCWGSDGNGRLGDGGGASDSDTPVQVLDGESPGTFTMVNLGNTISCAIGTDNKAYCWGADTAGAAGNGSDGGGFDPQLVHAGESEGTFKFISAGHNGACAIGTNGRAYCWGESDEGRLGNSTTTPDQDEPVQVDSGASPGYWTEVHVSADNTNHRCGLATDGKAYCWGESDEGRLGNGTTTPDVSTPVEVLAGEGPGIYSTITVGTNHSCGIAHDGKAYCWGGGGSGELGDNGSSNQSTPVEVHAGESPGYFKEIAAGQNFTCAVGIDNNLYCWGSAAVGKLGNGTTAGTQREPVSVLLDLEPEERIVDLDTFGRTVVAAIQRSYENPPAPCEAGEIVFADLFTPNTSTDLTTETITITNIEGECDLHIVSESGDARIILNSVDQGASVTQVKVSNGDTLTLQIESPSTQRATAKTYISIGNQQQIHETTTIRKVVFQTSTTHAGNMGGIAGADAICAARASEASLPGTFLAWISDDNSYPAARFSHWDYGYYNTNGAKTVDDFADLTDGTIDDDIDRDEDGNSIGAPERTWTATTDDGYQDGSVNCNNWTSSASGVSGGHGNSNNSLNNWSNENTDSCDTDNRLYCFEQ